MPLVQLESTELFDSCPPPTTKLEAIEYSSFDVGPERVSTASGPVDAVKDPERFLPGTVTVPHTDVEVTQVYDVLALGQAGQCSSDRRILGWGNGCRVGNAKNRRRHPPGI